MAVRHSPCAGPDTLLAIDATQTAEQGPAGGPAPPVAADARESRSPLDRLALEEDARLNHWKQGESLGRGAYGEVFKAMVGGKFMAAKKIPLLYLGASAPSADKEINSLLLEINTLKRLRHKRIVRYHGCVRQDGDDPAVLIFLEFMPSGSIKGVLEKFGAYGTGLVSKYTRQILEGLAFLHAEKIVHRDVKGANILIDAQGDAKLADFGACRELEALHNTVTGGMRSIHGSVFWMAPEVMRYKAGRRSDVWSVGCTVIEMITALPPWPNLRTPERMSVAQMLQRIVDGPDGPPLPEKMPSDCRNLLELCLQRDHTKRPYCEQLLRHRFVNKHQEHSHARPAAASDARPPAAKAWDPAPPGPPPRGPEQPTPPPDP